METTDGLAVAIGAFVAVAGSILFIMRTHSLDGGEKDPQGGVTGMRRVALRNVLVAYTIIAWLCVVATVIIGDENFIRLSALFAVIMSMGLLRVWLVGDGASSRGSIR